MQQAVKNYGLYESDRIHLLPVEDIIPNPGQPRKHFDQEALQELADSILRYGVLQPLTVRARFRKYELVAGERRLRAAKLAGLARVPCIILEIDTEDSSLIALVENLQRRDLNYIEEAEGLAQLIRSFHMSQEEAARRIGKSQSAVANKLRLLKLPRDILDALRDAGLTERHARALLRLSGNEQRRDVLYHIAQGSYNVAKTEAYIDALLRGEPFPESPDQEAATATQAATTAVAAPAAPMLKKKDAKPMYVLKDVRLFLNTVNRGMEMMKQSGIGASCGRAETDTELVLTITIPKAGHP